MNKQTAAPQTSMIRRIFSNTEVIILLASVILMLASYIVNDTFFSQYNMSTLFRTMSFVTIVAFGQTLILLLGDIDLSVGAIACFTAVVSGIFMTTWEVNPYLIFVLGLAIGCGCGLLNAFFITKFNITPFIITLATSQIFTGLVYVITEGHTVMGIPAAFTVLGQGMVFGWLPVPVIIMAVTGIILFCVLRYTPFGRYIYAIGGNAVAAKLVGINVRFNRSMVYVVCGFLSALAGMLMMARLGSAQPTVGTGWVMPSITAAVLGGTSMSGGRGGILGTVVGALLMTVISNAIVIMHVSTYMEEVIVGSVVIVAVLIDAIRTNMSVKKA